MPPELKLADPLSEILDAVKLKSILLERSQLSAPWGFHVPVGADGKLEFPRQFDMPVSVPKPPAAGGWLIAALSGNCWLEVDGAGAPIELSEGSVAVITRPLSHSIRDSLATPARPIWEVLPPPNAAEFKRISQPASLSDSLSGHSRLFRPPSVQIKGPGPTTELLTSILFFDPGHGTRLLSALPPVLHISRNDPWVPKWISEVLTALEREAADGRAGAVSVVSRLTHVLFDHAVRSFVSQMPRVQGNWLSAIMDEEIGPVLRIIHGSPEQPWTVQSLADQVAMSRSTFALRFHELVGQPPLKYLTDYRLNKAAHLLKTQPLAVKEVATQVGYESLASFCNAFKRSFDTSPGSYRRGVPA